MNDMRKLMEAVERLNEDSEFGDSEFGMPEAEFDGRVVHLAGIEDKRDQFRTLYTWIKSGLAEDDFLDLAEYVE